MPDIIQQTFLEMWLCQADPVYFIHNFTIPEYVEVKPNKFTTAVSVIFISFLF